MDDQITPLPTQDHDRSDSDLESQNDTNTYLVRITAYDKFTFEELKTFIDNEFQIARYIIGEELLPKRHYHLVLTTDVSFSMVNMRDLIKAFLIPLWKTVGHTLPRGFGNKQYNCEEADSEEGGVTYALKEKGNMCYVGYTPEYIAKCIEQSFTKKDTKSFSKELQLLRDEFQSSNMDIKEFMTNFVILKSKYDQMVNMQHAYQTALSQLIQRNPEQAEDYVINYLYKQ